MTPQMKDYHWNEDFDRARRFLGNLFFVQKAYTNWIPTTLENVKFGPGGTEYLDEKDEYLKIWEENGRIVALTYTKPTGGCILSIHPDYMTFAGEIVQWMQKRVKELSTNDSVKMTLIVDDADNDLIPILIDLGFVKDEIEGDNQIRRPDAPIPEYKLPEGYSIRHAVAEDYEKYRDVQGAVFKHMASMLRSQFELYRSASFYHDELDIVAVAPSGEFAAFCTARIDPVSRIAELEPVGTHPDHRKLGLGKAVILESFKRLKKYNPSAIVILGAAPSEGAKRLYKSVGFVNNGEAHYWAKTV